MDCVNSIHFLKIKKISQIFLIWLLPYFKNSRFRLNGYFDNMLDLPKTLRVLGKTCVKTINQQLLLLLEYREAKNHDSLDNRMNAIMKIMVYIMIREWMMRVWGVNVCFLFLTYSFHTISSPLTHPQSISIPSALTYMSLETSPIPSARPHFTSPLHLTSYNLSPHSLDSPTSPSTPPPPTAK